MFDSENVMHMSKRLASTCRRVHVRRYLRLITSPSLSRRIILLQKLRTTANKTLSSETLKSFEKTSHNSYIAMKYDWLRLGATVTADSCYTDVYVSNVNTYCVYCFRLAKVQVV